MDSGHRTEELEAEVARLQSALTDGEQTALALARTNRLLDTLFDNILAQVAYLDPDMNVVRVNETYARGCGHPAEALIGRNHFHLFPNEENEAIFRRVLQTGEPYEARARPFVFPDQPERGVTYWDWWLRPIRDPSATPEGLLLSLVDVTATQRARLEIEHLNTELRDTNRRKDRFLSILGHELRNPLAAIAAAARLLCRAGLPGSAGRAAAIVDRQSAHMVRLLEDLLDIPRLTHGKILLRRQRLSLASAVESALESASPAIEQARHRIHLSLPASPVAVDADPVRLAQIIFNLLVNAAKYTPPPGDIFLTVEPHSDRVAIRVRDTGIGISPEFLPRVFDPFTQADHSRALSQDGFGIGLSMVRSLTEMHGGSVEARSTGHGHGSEFVVWLPLADPRAEASPAPAPPPVPPTRVLVADDNADAADLLALLLEDAGYQVATAYDGPQAIHAAAAFGPHAAILDLDMPGMHGCEVARRLRADPAFAGILLIALTGCAAEEQRRRATAAGFDAHLIKPADFQTILALLRPLAPQP